MRKWDLKFDVIKRLSQKTSVYVTRVVKEDERSKFGYELEYYRHQKWLVNLKTTQSPKNTEQTSWWTTVTCGSARKQVAVMQIRNAIIYATYDFRQNTDFMKFISQFFQETQQNSTELFETGCWNTSLLEPIRSTT